MKVGIDQLSFYTPRYFLPLEVLARQRGVDYAKFAVGLGQEQMGVTPPDEDIVTLAANAAEPLVRDGGAGIDLLLFATESGIDQSKAAGLFVHGLMGLPAECRVAEIKEACYGGTVALQMAAAMVMRRPASRALVIASDIARYDLASPGEPTQGCGAVAMLVTANPRILALDPEVGLHAEDVMDFWRPNYRDEALVDGKYSTRLYLGTVEKAFARYAQASGRSIDDLARCCYHLPFTNIARKAHERLLKLRGRAEIGPGEVDAAVVEALGYNRRTGNSYCASLYQSLACLLDQCEDDLSERRVGLFSYGSGSMGEFFSGVVQPEYRQHLLREQHKRMLAERSELTYQEYEDMFQMKVPQDGWDYVFAQYRTGPFRFGGITGHKRRYERAA
ncbi:MAG: hydroxymethylglutaryl-CoA synthase [Verrucomicrobia bacterium]|nr:hydroxymethylglutaryl-CoA synthase [Verrucomicrobiota bacterium]